MDGGILVVSAPDGPMPQTKEHILLARQVIYAFEAVDIFRLISCGFHHREQQHRKNWNYFIMQLRSQRDTLNLV